MIQEKENLKRDEVIVVQNGNTHVHALCTQVGSPADYEKIEGELSITVARIKRPVLLHHGKFQNRTAGERPVINNGEHWTLKVKEGTELNPAIACVTVQRESTLSGAFRAVYD